ncbi:MAG: hypothetical protein ACHQKZ_05390 [Solirubrobacterales bacterium]|jgi:hypothetical protein
MKPKVAVLLGLLAFAVGDGAWAQGLGDAARREKERREKAGQGDASAKVVTDEELRNNPGQLANDPSIPPAAALGRPDQTGSKSRRLGSAGAASGSAGSASSPGIAAPIGGGEDTWRSGMRTLRDNIARLEKEVATLDGKATGLAYGVPTSGGPPKVNGRPLWVETPDQRMGREGSNASAQMAWQKERADVLDRLERARTSLTRARADLVSFEESARRQAIPPGWLR